MTDDDLALAALLGAPPLEPDPAFAARVAALVEAEAAWRAARRAAWRRFAGEAIGALAVTAGAIVIARVSPVDGAAATGPGLAAALALLSWLITRPEPRAAA